LLTITLIQPSLVKGDCQHVSPTSRVALGFGALAGRQDC
jgi:hypothetical protein